MMHTRWKNWVHVTKLDPDKMLPAGAIAEIVSSGTDALMLSGTLNVTAENMAALAKEARASGLPLVVEPAGPEAVLWDGVDLVFVPSVLNSPEVQWIVGKHRSWIQRQQVEWEKVVPEAYIVLNPDSAVGKLTKATCTLTGKEVASFASLADHYFHFPSCTSSIPGSMAIPGSSGRQRLRWRTRSSIMGAGSIRPQKPPRWPGMQTPSWSAMPSMTRASGS